MLAWRAGGAGGNPRRNAFGTIHQYNCSDGGNNRACTHVRHRRFAAPMMPRSNGGSPLKIGCIEETVAGRGSWGSTASLAARASSSCGKISG